MSPTCNRVPSNGSKARGVSARYLVRVGTDAFDKIRLGLTQSLHQFTEGGLRKETRTQDINNGNAARSVRWREGNKQHEPGRRSSRSAINTAQHFRVRKHMHMCVGV